MREAARWRWGIFGFVAVVVMMVGVLAAAIIALPVEASGLAPRVQQSLDESGAKNPVTAVLLNFRGYDTMLELTVMLLAVLGARALTGGRLQDEVPPPAAASDPLLDGFVRLITPIMIVVAGYLLWVGGHAPGGAFQAGAVLAALGVLLQLAGFPWFRHLSGLSERCLLISGVLAFLAVGVGTMSSEREFLEYPASIAKWLILLIETIAAISIAAILMALYRSGVLHSNSISLTTQQPPERRDR